MTQKIERKALAAALLFCLAACSGQANSSSSTGTIPQNQNAEASPAPHGSSLSAYARNTLRLPPDAGQKIRAISPMQIAHGIGLDAPGNKALQTKSVSLKPWGETETFRVLGRNFMIDPNRMVYEVTTTFSTPYAVRANVWSSGHRTFIIDAVTGKVYLSRTWGNQIQNEGFLRARAFQLFHRKVTVQRVNRGSGFSPRQ